jgi:hypothetical protein
VLSGCVPFDMMKRERILTKIFHKGKMPFQTGKKAFGRKLSKGF